MVDDGRARATTPPRLAVIISSTVLGGLIAATAVIGSNALEPKLAAAAEAALREAGISGIQVRFDGREAFLSSAQATPGEFSEAERVVESVDGVRWATVVTAERSEHPTIAVVEDADGVVTVGGTVGTAAEAARIQDAAVTAFGPGTVTDVQVVDGTVVSPWVEQVPGLFHALAQVDHVQFLVAEDSATLSGEAADPDAVAQQAEDALSGITLSSSVTQAGPSDEEAAAINGTVIRFIADSVTLDAKARAQVATLADALRRFPTIDVTLTGHIAIPVSTETAAIAFSLQRAQSVADALIADGIDPARLGIVGAGSSQPVGDNSTAAGAAANRRVTVLIVEAE